MLIANFIQSFQKFFVALFVHPCPQRSVVRIQQKRAPLLLWKSYPVKTMLNEEISAAGDNSILKQFYSYHTFCLILSMSSLLASPPYSPQRTGMLLR